MLDLFVDIDACPVYPQVLRAAQQHSLDLYVVTRSYLAGEPGVYLILADGDRRAGNDWIAANIAAHDICVTGQSDLAARCLVRGAIALAPTGATWKGGTLADALNSASTASRPVFAEGGCTWAVDTRRFARALTATIYTLRATERRRLRYTSGIVDPVGSGSAA
jgi:uncharacterized protein YaiI (UPF0178 family)